MTQALRSAWMGPHQPGFLEWRAGANHAIATMPREFTYRTTLWEQKIASAKMNRTLLCDENFSLGVARQMGQLEDSTR